MNLDIWYLVEHFRILPVTGKIAVVGGYVLVLLLVMLWATFPTRKRDTRTSSTNTDFTRCPTENPNKCANNYQENENLQKPKKGDIIGSSLLSKPANNRGNWYLHYQTDDKTDNPKQHFRRGIISFVRWATPPFPISHICTIVNRLRRLVNQSGKEPAGWFCKVVIDKEGKWTNE